MNREVADRPATYAQVLSEPTFRVLFGTRTLGVAATTLRIVALSTVVFTATGSPLLAAMTFGIAFLPQVFGGLVLGALADRTRPRRLIATGYVLECAVAAVLALTAPPIWTCLVLVAASGCLAPVFTGASNRWVAEVLTGDAYVVGRSLSSTAAAAAQLVGFGAAGLAVSSLGARDALLVSAACQLVSGLIVATRLPDLPLLAAPATSTRPSLVRATWSGNRALLANRPVRRLLLAQWLPPGLVTGAEALVVVYAAHRGFPSGSSGLLLACIPLGMLVGNVVLGRFCVPSARERLVAPLALLLGAPLAPLAANPPFAVTAVLLVLSGCGFAYGLGLQQAFRDAVPSAVQGQAFGLLATGLQTLQGLGPALAGLLAELLPSGTVMAIAGCATAGVAGWLWLTLPGVDRGDRAGSAPGTRAPG